MTRTVSDKQDLTLELNQIRITVIQVRGIRSPPLLIRWDVGVVNLPVESICLENRVEPAFFPATTGKRLASSCVYLPRAVASIGYGRVWCVEHVPIPSHIVVTKSWA